MGLKYFHTPDDPRQPGWVMGGMPPTPEAGGGILENWVLVGPDDRYAEFNLGNFSSERLIIAINTYAPGVEHGGKDHFHPDLEQIYYVISGRGVITVGEEEREVGPGSFSFMPRNVKHGALNTGSEPMTVAVISSAL